MGSKGNDVMAISEQFCENCGAANAPLARFCQYCAAPLPFKYTTGTLPEQTLLSGRYQLEERIGQGGMGAVYKASDTRFNNRSIAIKEMSRAGLSPANVQEAEASFEREAQILADLLHPNLPRIYDHFTENERSYLVMDFIEGQTLENYLDLAQGSSLPIDQVLEWGKQLCDVLGYLHTHQPPIVFRDLKPSNVMINKSGHIFLIDFGIARIFKPGQSHDTVALGSPGFAAPEQYGKAQSSPRSDIYSLGALLHNLLTGVDPSEQPFFFCPASQLNPAVPPILEQLLQQMLEMQSEKRPASVQEVLKVLRQVELQRVNPSYGLSSQASLVDQALTGVVSVVSGGGGMTASGSTMRSSSASLPLQEAYRYYTQNRLQEALKLYDRLTQTESNNPLVWQGRGLALAQLGQHSEALASFERALKLDPDLVVSLNGKGTALNILRRNKEALRAFDRAILLEKDNVIAWNGKGAVLSALGQYEQAANAFQVVLLFDPHMAQAWGNKGLVLRQLRRYTEALRAFDEALALDPNAASYWNGKGMVLSEMRQLNESLRAFQEALRINPNYAPALSGIGDIYYSQRKLKPAYAQYEKALQCDPRYVKAWMKRAIVLADMGQTQKALESYDEALRLNPRYGPVWNGKASLLCILEQYQQALYAYNQALLYSPNAAESWNGKGNALYHLGDYQSALDAYERALRLSPRMVSALHNKSLVLRQLQRYDEALEAAESAIAIAPEDPDNWSRKAEALKKLRRGREARNVEKEIARLRSKF
jgi:tetratricopeptide (TPR) repeat protein